MLIMENIFQLTARKKLTKTGPCMRSPFKGVHGVTPYLQCQYQFIIIEIKTVLVSKPSYGKGVLMSRLIRQNVKLLSECLTFQVYKKTEQLQSFKKARSCIFLQNCTLCMARVINLRNIIQKCFHLALATRHHA